MIKRALVVTATVLTVGAATAGTANAYPPVEDSGTYCPAGTYLRVAHCEPDARVELGGALGLWFGHLGALAGGR